MASKTRKAATVADLIAAAQVGAIDPAAVFVPADVAERTAVKAAEAARAEVLAANTAAHGAAAPVAMAAPLASDHHACGIAGCRHGAGHTGDHTVQPDRQVKLQCPSCGAVARMTNGAIARAAKSSGGSGYPTCADGSVMAEAARRTYNRRAS